MRMSVNENFSPYPNQQIVCTDTPQVLQDMGLPTGVELKTAEPAKTEKPTATGQATTESAEAVAEVQHSLHYNSHCIALHCLVVNLNVSVKCKDG